MVASWNIDLLSLVSFFPHVFVDLLVLVCDFFDYGFRLFRFGSSEAEFEVEFES